MKEETNYTKLETIFRGNGGFITRQDADEALIPSWFLSDFVRRKGLIKLAPGFYAEADYAPDEYFILQRRYSKYIFSGLSALYLHHLTDKIPVFMEVTSPQGYNPSRQKMGFLSIRRISNPDIYSLGIAEVETSFGHVVRAYDEERTVCDIIKARDRYDSETFIKAIRTYVRNVNNQAKLFEYARAMGIEKKVFEVVEVFANEN